MILAESGGDMVYGEIARVLSDGECLVMELHDASYLDLPTKREMISLSLPSKPHFYQSQNARVTIKYCEGKTTITVLSQQNTLDAIIDRRAIIHRNGHCDTP